ncbi:stage V sporulation protein D (sporulation-specific penicillin-binding protein) [Peptoniphilus olsenii]|uniref:Stage V sporulation protein D (Sporulation-specific penicillin-binding protein) n=1 Tax=Peptoniphilus olsenii TaxID=411570 RepID=A0ABV2JAS9_9FIRM
MKNNNNRARNKKGKNRFSRKLKSSNKSIFWFFVILAFLFLALIFRLFYIQIVESEELTISALNQLTRTEVINSKRGIIYDRNKKELAVNVTRCNIFYNTKIIEKTKEESNSEFVKRQNKLFDEDAEVIAQVLGEKTEDIREKMKGDKVVRLASNVERAKAKELVKLRTQVTENNKKNKTNKKNLAAMSIDDVTRRFYPFNNLASYIIGFTNDENVGQYGIEASYDEELTGIAGKNVSLKDNAFNKIPLTDEETYAPKEGYSIVLSIDSNIQQFAEIAALKAKEENDASFVSVIVQDTMTGEILAMTTKDDYNLNKPKEPINNKQEENWDEYTDKEKTAIWYSNWRDFNVNDQYEPGSTFKLITAAAAIEQNKAQPNSVFTCNGAMRVGDRTLTCTSHQRGGKTLAEAIEQSCNMTMIQIAQKLGKEEFLKYIDAFGFGKKTGIELYGESIGIVPQDPSTIHPVTLATMGYGHSIAVTPLQLTNAVSAISNGGYLNKPTLVKEVVDANGNIVEKKKTELKRRIISEDTSEKMKSMMYRVVENGTGKLAAVPGYEVGGKSGTANIATPTGYLDAFNSSFVGVAPLNDPKLTVLVVVNSSKKAILGGVVAAPVVSEVLSQSLNYLGIPKTEEVEEKDEYTTVPDVYGKLLDDAGKSLISSGLRFNTGAVDVKDNAVVIGQNPGQGSYVLKDSIIDLVIDNNDSDTVVVPDFSKKSKKEVQSILNSMNLEYNIKGDGDYVSQSPRAGEKLDIGSTVIINYSVSKDETDKDKNNIENNNNKNKVVSNNSNNSKKNDTNKNTTLNKNNKKESNS